MRNSTSPARSCSTSSPPRARTRPRRGARPIHASSRSRLGGPYSRDRRRRGPTDVAMVTATRDLRHLARDRATAERPAPVGCALASSTIATRTRCPLRPVGSPRGTSGHVTLNLRYWASTPGSPVTNVIRPSSATARGPTKCVEWPEHAALPAVATRAGASRNVRVSGRSCQLAGTRSSTETATGSPVPRSGTSVAGPFGFVVVVASVAPCSHLVYRPPRAADEGADRPVRAVSPTGGGGRSRGR